MNDMTINPDRLKIKLFADGADIEDMRRLANLSYIQGLTTNPTLMAQAGVSNYESFAKEVLTFIEGKPISFEVFSDDFDDMERQANKIAGWGDNIYVKIPITNTKGNSSAALVKRLSANGVKLNITALLTLEQVSTIHDVLSPDVPAIVSVFAGRVADTGRDPIPMMISAKEILADQPKTELLWASPREVLNIIQADQSGCHIITATSGILNKLSKLDYDLEKFSLDTVRMFYNDAQKAKYTL
jgi:transaldolase